MYEVRLNESIPDCCSDCRFMYDYLYCIIDGDIDLTLDKEYGRPSHCKLIPMEIQADIVKSEDITSDIQ